MLGWSLKDAENGVQTSTMQQVKTIGQKLYFNSGSDLLHTANVYYHYLFITFVYL